jgi:Leucine-rich repeat (LRR) protein
MNIKITPLNTFRLFVIICLLFSSVILPANNAAVVQARSAYSEETPTETPDTNEEYTPTPEVTEGVTETPVPEETEEVTQTPVPEVTEEVTPTPEDLIETPEPPDSDQQPTEQPVEEEADSQSTGICASVTEIPQSECEALVALYQSTNGSEWKTRTGWLTTSTPCSWSGVQCAGGRVQEIQLASNKLTGTLPTQIGNFPALKVLSVQNNAVGGEIPSTLGNLVSLEVLLLSFNSFQGSIPTTIGNLNMLERVELSRNKLTGAIPTQIEGMTNLRFFWAYDNKLEGPIPATINNLKFLTTFHVSDNQLSGAIPDTSAISNLKELRAANNQLTGSIHSSISSKGNLEVLNLSNNAITGTISADFGTLPNLRELILSGNQLTGSIPSSLGGATKLITLNLGNNLLTGSIPATLGNLTNLTELNLGKNNLSGDIPSLQNLVKLKTLYLDNNQLTGTWPIWLENLTLLERLNISNNIMGDLLPTQIGNLVNLRLLDISRNHFWGEIPLSITKLTKLNTVRGTYTDIGHNHLRSKNSTVRTFLSKKDPDWEKTQTPVNPTPVIQSLNPPSVILNGPEITLEIRGKSMMAGMIVYVDGVEFPSTFVNSWTVEIVIPAVFRETEREIVISAKNPWPTIGPSAGYKFYVSDILPAVGSTAQSRRPFFLWYEVPEADLYQLQISTAKNFSTNVTRYTSTTNSLTVTKDLPLNKMMYWRVRGRVDGSYQDWSPTYAFRSARPPANFALASPANNSLTTNYKPKLSWKIPSLPSGTVFEKYQLQVSFSPTFDLGTIVLDQSITTRGKPTYTIPTGILEPNTKYFWRVRAFNTFAHYSNWSAARTIRAAMLPVDPPSDPQGLTPRPTFSWSPADGATSYTIQFSIYSNFSTLLQTGRLAGTEFTPGKDLPKNRIIHWRVRANGPNGPSLWTRSSFRSANPPSTPTLSLPKNGVLTTNYIPKLIWRASSLPSGTQFKHYRLQIALDNTFTEPLVHEEFINSRSTTSFEVPAGMLTPNTRYFWRLQSWNTADHYSTWSAVRYFRAAMLPVETLIKPEQDSTVQTLRPTFEWSAVTDATSYAIQLSLYPNFSSLLTSATPSGVSYTPKINLPKNKVIYWRVRANGINGPTAWKDGSFRSANPPSTPSLVSPANGALLKIVPANLDWSNSTLPAGTDFKHYEVQISTSTNLDSVTPISTGLGNRLLSHLEWGDIVPALEAKTKYYWRVRSVNAEGHMSNWSTRWSFTTP